MNALVTQFLAKKRDNGAQLKESRILCGLGWVTAEFRGHPAIDIARQGTTQRGFDAMYNFQQIFTLAFFQDSVEQMWATVQNDETIIWQNPSDLDEPESQNTNEIKRHVSPSQEVVKRFLGLKPTVYQNLRKFHNLVQTYTQDSEDRRTQISTWSESGMPIGFLFEPAKKDKGQDWVKRGVDGWTRVMYSFVLKLQVQKVPLPN